MKHHKSGFFGSGSHACLFLLLLLWVPPQRAQAQTESSFTVAVGAHALTVPWHLRALSSHLNPAAMVGMDRNWKSGTSGRLFYALELGFIRHRWWMTGISVEPEVGIGLALPGGFTSDLRLGLGYMHWFWRRKTFELQDEGWAEPSNLGRPSLTLPLSFSLGYTGDSSDPLPVSPFLMVRWSLQGMFLEETPAMTHMQLLGGVRVHPGTRKPKGGR